MYLVQTIEPRKSRIGCYFTRLHLAFNEKNCGNAVGTFNFLPITSGGNFARTAGFAVSLSGLGLRTTGVVRCDQPRALDLAARKGKKLESVPSEIVDEVLARLATILE